MKMSLKDISIKETYDSDNDDILKEFYLPILSKSVSYKRICGQFSSSSLAIAAQGIINLIKNSGKMMVISSAKFSESDVEMLRKSVSNPESLIQEIFFEDLDKVRNEFILDHLKAFGWMLANNLLEIKIAIPVDNLDTPIDSLTLNKMGIFHQKIGIIEDHDNNIVTFSGSQNETLLGWCYNIEEFKVFRSWLEGDKNKLNADVEKFEKFWKNQSQRTKVIDLPTAIKNKLIEIAPKDFQELKLEKWILKRKHIQEKISLREYQNEAIENWFLNNHKGIFEMATGTGKTFTALGCYRELLNVEKKLVTIIACPYNHLITQWKREISNFGIDYPIIIADSTKRKWKDTLADKIIDINIDNENYIIILTTQTTFASEDFKKIICNLKSPTFLIVDEVHGIGSPKRNEGLLSMYQYRLGLSATPERWFDEEGTRVLYNYFDKIVFRFPLSKAIGRFLTEYEYYPHFINLTDEEINEYQATTKKITKAYYSSKERNEKENWYQLLCIKRQKIIKNAKNKYLILRSILGELVKLKHLIVYCTPNQIENVQEILIKYNIVQHKFTEKEGTKPKREYSGLSQRDFLLNNFTDGHIQCLVAIKCLDEGVNIPQARVAIMMANSGNPREFIQRRGRILRKYPGKKVAIIHDIIVMPNFDKIDDFYIAQMEKKILRKELLRYKEFAELAKNSIYCLKLIELLEEKYGIYW